MFTARRIALAALIVGVFVVVVHDPAAQQVAFTIDQVMSAPFPTDLVAAPGGERVAWVFNARGVRNIWVAESPDYEGRRLTDYAEDDGQEIAGLTWAPDGETVVYVRGGGTNSQGEHPNPLSDPAGIDQAMWAVSIQGSEPRRLAEGHSPTVSPRGDRVAFIRSNEAWWVPLDGSEDASQVIKARGGTGTLRWSPTGSQLAFVSNRGDHSFVGVYDLASASVRYLDPSVDRDGNPAWSPDGAQIAFIRIPASRSLFTFGPRREAEPWSIRVADVSDGHGDEVWKASPGRGSVFHGIVADDQLQWAHGDRLVFPWEQDGWSHLFTVPVSGGPATVLTPGEFEVEHVALTQARASVIFSSNQDDLHRRHLWRVSVDGGEPEPVTTGDGIEWAPVPAGEAVAFLRSDAQHPAHPAIMIGSSAAKALAPASVPSDFPMSSLVTPQPVVFPAADGMKIPGQLFLPPDLAEGDRRRPAVVFFHGGSRRQMLLGWHYMGYYHNTYALNQYLASRGYIVLSVNYRSGVGYGLEFREAPDYGAHGASEFNDVLGAGLYLQNRADVDPDRIGLWGGSYGGYLTALGLAKASDLFAAGVDLHGVHDWNVVIRNFAPSYDPFEHPDTARLAFESSPMAHVKTWRSPVLLIHGDDDRNVPFSETVDLVEALRGQGVEFEQIVFPDEVHGFLRHARWVRAFEAASEFFDRHLGNERAPGR